MAFICSCVLAICLAVVCLGQASPATTTKAVDPELAALPTCPFSRWQGEPRYCYECRWCPFRARTCCEMEDEIDVLKSVNVSGSKDWDCFITIVHFQQCAMCSPDAKKFVQKKLIPFVWDPRNLSILACRSVCKFIHKQCQDAVLLNGERIVTLGQSVEDFCKGTPEVSTDELPCYDGASRHSLGITSGFAALLVAALLL